MEKIKLNLGCGEDIRKGWINCDFYPENKDVEFIDLNKLPLPFPDDYADEILVSQVLEHLECHPYEFIKDCFRILKKGGRLTVGLPSFNFALPHLRGYHPPAYMNVISGYKGKHHVCHNGVDKMMFAGDAYHRALGTQLRFTRKPSLRIFLRRFTELFFSMASEDITWEFIKK